MSEPTDSSKMVDDHPQPGVQDTEHGSVEGRNDKGPPQTDQTSHVATESLARAHEVQEVNLRAILRFAVGLLVALVVIHVVLWWIIIPATGRTPVPRLQLRPAQVTPETPPGPGIKAQPSVDRAAALAPAYEHIGTYGWVDEATGTVHIPVDRALQLLVQRGLPARTGGNPPTFGLPPAYTLDSKGGQVSAQDLEPK